MALPQQNRLKSSRDFGRVHRRGARAATHHLAARALKPKMLPTERASDNRISADGQPSALVSSFGISISRKVSKRAVVRNRIKRQIRAVLQRFLPDVAPGWQVVIVVRSAAVECEFDDFLRELEYLLKKLGIFTQSREGRHGN
ncbi:hypothetical protein BH23CYA1_BH23CYA1_20860 [soil metagenome]|uniref:ribonuclease P protein component n=1 Tax=Leptolyngbya sp. BC1307 TaxID=2029589 RepID=UPI000EFAECA6|nr:ribonuclease P protein component [Leptolyngbya sp. BC1307]